uniref:Predicted gene, 58353 n=1 Tax=Mus musculus TaxID=10090 RepID=A0AAQ4VMT8_MOUSE
MRLWVSERLRVAVTPSLGSGEQRSPQ